MAFLVVAASSQALLVFHIMGPLGSLPLAAITYRHNIRVVKEEERPIGLPCAAMLICLLAFSAFHTQRLSIFYIP